MRRTGKRRNPTTGHAYPWLVRSTAMINHFTCPTGSIGTLAKRDLSAAIAASYRFEWALPGHGHSQRRSADEMHAHLERCVSWMKGVKTRARG